jgi:hypothetical protein
VSSLCQVPLDCRTYCYQKNENKRIGLWFCMCLIQWSPLNKYNIMYNFKWEDHLNDRKFGNNILIDLCLLTGDLEVCVIDLGFDWIQCGVLCIPHPYLSPYIGITMKYRSLLLSVILIIIQSHCDGVSHRNETACGCWEVQKAGRLNRPRLITGDQICFFKSCNI